METESGISFVRRIKNDTTGGRVIWEQLFQKKVLRNEIIEIRGTYMSAVNFVFNHILTCFNFPVQMSPGKASSKSVLCITARPKSFVSLLSQHYCNVLNKHLHNIDLVKHYCSCGLGNIKFITPQVINLKNSCTPQLLQAITRESAVDMIAIDNVNKLEVPLHTARRYKVNYLMKLDSIKKTLENTEIITVFTNNSYSPFVPKIDALKHVDVVLDVVKFQQRGIKIIYSGKDSERSIEIRNIAQIGI